MTGPADDRPASEPEAEGEVTGRQAIALALFEHRLRQLGARETARLGWRNLWLAHHWPADYGNRCVRIGSRPVCRRCAALYPLGLLVALVSAAGYAPWPTAVDPWPIWLLSIPATIAYAGEALGWFRYDARWQVATTLVAAVAFGRGLGYELVGRWSPEFWGPIAVFGTLWLSATLLADRSSHERDHHIGHHTDQRAATASTSSSSEL